MTSYAYVATEGPHDVAFLAELLRPWGFKRLSKLSQVDPYWEPLIPRTFPHGDDLLKRVPVPTFFAAEGRAIALDSAEGIDKLYNRIEENLALLGSPPAVGVVLDADGGESPADRFAALAAKLSTLGLQLPDLAGDVSLESPRCGAFVLPDNTASGTLEALLDECAERNYRGLRAEANNYVERVESLTTDADESRRLTAKDLKELSTPPPAARHSSRR